MRSSHIRPGDRVDRVVPADVLDEHQDLARAARSFGGERAAVHGAGLLVDRSRAARTRSSSAYSVDRVSVASRAAAARCRSLPSGRRTPCPGRSRSSSCASRSSPRGRLSRARVLTTTAFVSQSTCTDDDVLDAIDQPLVAQVADRQRLGRGAQRHQRQDLAACRRRASADARRRSACRALRRSRRRRAR